MTPVYAGIDAKERQKLLPFHDPREQARLERIERLLARLGQPPDKSNSAAKFDYAEATAIAQRTFNAKKLTVDNDTA